jgi:hypothetical protein
MIGRFKSRNNPFIVPTFESALRIMYSALTPANHNKSTHSMLLVRGTNILLVLITK